MRQSKLYLLLVLSCLLGLSIYVWWLFVKEGLSSFPGVPKVAHRLGIIIPFRERFTDLILFLPHMEKYLNEKGIPHTFYIINQVDEYRFNRGFLLNVGFQESGAMESSGRLPACTMIALHDVDLLPLDPHLNYEHSSLAPYHLVPHWLHPVYHYYSAYLGGVMLIARQSFVKVNGFSNLFWGWGREDDEFGLRLKQGRLTVRTDRKVIPKKPKFHHTHLKSMKRETVPYYNPVTHERDVVTGLETIDYTLISQSKFILDGVTAWLINVKLKCNLMQTSYCLPSQ